MDEGDKFEFEYRWRLHSKDARPRANLSVDVVGARDIRVTDMQRAPGYGEDGEIAGTFAINTSKATDSGHYDIIVSGRVPADGAETDIYARPSALEVTGRSTNVHVSSAR
jgi:hypothetical protein